MRKAGVVAFAFGEPSSIKPNQTIAQIALQKARELEAPIYTQFDVYIGDINLDVYFIEEDEEGPPPPTLKIASEAVSWARERGLQELWVAAAKPHLWRCLRDLEYAAREADVQVEIKVCEEIERYPENEWFCGNSIQVRTRSRKEWQRRERILKTIPMFIYKCVAS